MRRAPASVSDEAERKIKKFTLARIRDSDALAALQDPIYETGQAPTRGKDGAKTRRAIFIDEREPDH